MTRALVAVAVALWTTVAHADEQAFRAAGELAARNDPRALAAYEAVGAARPVTVWTDDAWVEAARLAEKQRDYDRARRDLEQAIAISSDPQLVRRAKNDLARLAEVAGGGGEWSEVAAEHQRLATDIADGGDPTAALEKLESLARANPRYPRGIELRIAMARAWETEDEVDRALAWLRDAIQIAMQPRASGVERARIELVRMLIRHRELAAAARELSLVRDPASRAALARNLDAAESWRVLRWIAIAVLAALGGVAAYRLRRRCGTWRAAARRLARPPIEVIYFVPIAAVVGAFASTGSPLVAKGVIAIFACTTIVAWISGATLEAARVRGATSGRHVLLHAAVVGVAMLAAVYLAVDHARLLDLVAETWRTGPGH